MVCKINLLSRELWREMHASDSAPHTRQPYSERIWRALQRVLAGTRYMGSGTSSTLLYGARLAARVATRFQP